MNTTNTASSKLYQEGNYTCVATSKYGTDAKHFLIKGEKIRYFKTNHMQGGGGGENVIFLSFYVPGEIANNDYAIFFRRGGGVGK